MTNILRLLFLTLMILVLGVSSETSGSFEVKELSSSEVSALEVLREKVSQAKEELQKAADIHNQALRELSDLEESTANKFSPSTGSCVNQKVSYRSVVIRGKYALISESLIPCDETGSRILGTGTRWKSGSVGIIQYQ